MLVLRSLTLTVTTLADIQHICDSNPDYYQAITGKKALPTEAADYFTDKDLPPGIKHNGRHRLGVYSGETLVGVTDILRGYRTTSDAWVSWLIIDGFCHGKGLGREAYALIETFINQWPEVSRVMLGIVTTNKRALTFWPHMGFTDTRERKPHKDGLVEAEVAVFEKPLGR